MNTQRRVFLDCGANNGCSVDLFRKHYPAGPQFLIHCFEPNPRFAGCFRDRDVTFHPEAVWHKDGPVNFYPARSRKASGSSLYKNKTTGNLKRVPMRVPGIALDKWMQRELSWRDQIVLKLDIEGAEYPVLRALLTSGTIDWVDVLFVEWHYDRIGLAKAEHDRLVNELHSRGITPRGWDGEQGWFEGMPSRPEVATAWPGS